jgi:protein-S-isoprenylcysteine O-methyltransferase Ste14
MISAQTIVLICWGIFLLYWIILWRKVKKTEKTEVDFSKIRWLVLWIVVLFIVFFRTAQPSSLFHIFPCQNAWMDCNGIQLLGAILSIVGLVIAMVARYTLSTNWSSNIDIKKDHELKTDGIYAYARHPIYTGISSMALGTVLVYQSLGSLIIAILVILFFIYKMKNEEALLMEHFPKAYTAYRKRTKAIIPFII